MTVDILGRPHKVKISKTSKEFHGFCDHDKKLIKLNKRDDDINATFVHEVLHGILHESGLKFILENHEGLEEALVRAIEHGLRTAKLIPEVDFDDYLDADDGSNVDSQEAVDPD